MATDVSHELGEPRHNAAMGPRRVSDRYAARIASFERCVALEVDGLVFVSEFLASAVFGDAPVAELGTWTVLPNFLPDDWGVSGGEVPEGDKRDLVTVGRLSPEKNHDFILDVVAEGRRYGRDLTLTIVGSGPEEGRLRERCAALGLDDLVVFAGMSTDVASIARRHRAYLHGSLHETFGIVLIEAMAVGLPVFAPPVEGVPEVFDDGVEGRYLALESAPRSAATLVAALDDDAWMQQASAAARRRVDSSFRTSVVGPKLEQFLFDVLEPGARSADPVADD